MRRLNRDGFAISALLYTLFVMFMLILLSILASLHARNVMVELGTIHLEDSYKGSEVLGNISDAINNKVAPVDGKYVFHIDDNSFDGIVNKSEVTSGSIKYSILDGVVKVTPTVNNGEGETSIRAFLLGGVDYTFSYDNSNVTGGTVKFCIIADNPECKSVSNNSVFKPTKDGTYLLKLGGAVKNTLYTFSNLKISGGNGTDCFSYLKKGNAIDRNIVFTPLACNSYDYHYSFENGTGAVMELIGIYNFEEE